MSSSALFEILRKVEAFKGLSDDDIRGLADVSTITTIEGGQRIFAQGDPANHAFVLVSGIVAPEMVRRSAVQPGDLFGEIGVFATEPYHRAASVEVMSPTATIIAIPYANLGGCGQLRQVIYDRMVVYLTDRVGAAEVEHATRVGEAHA